MGADLTDKRGGAKSTQRAAAKQGKERTKKMMYHVYLTNEAETDFLYIGYMDEQAARWYEYHLNAYIIED